MIKIAIWNPWRGCHKCSVGCEFCYIHKGDQRRGKDTNKIIKTEKFDYPIKKNKKGEYSIKPGGMVYICFSSDFLIAEADEWRPSCWEMIKERSDLNFLFLTKRIERFLDCIPEDWQDGYDNVTVGCTVENQAMVDKKLTIFSSLPIIHKNIILQPLIGPVSIKEYLDEIELVVVGGESNKNARPLYYEWVLNIRKECIDKKVAFEFRQCGSKFIKDGKEFILPTRDLMSQAKKANLNYKPEKKDLK